MPVMDTGASAAARLWDMVRDDGVGACSRCAAQTLPGDLVVLYRTPLASGGRDVAANVRLVCRWCSSRH